MFSFHIKMPKIPTLEEVVSMREAVDLLGQDDAGEYDVVDGQTDDENVGARQRTAAARDAAFPAAARRRFPDARDDRHVAGNRDADPDRQQRYAQLFHRGHRVRHLEKDYCCTLARCSDVRGRCGGRPSRNCVTPLMTNCSIKLSAYEITSCTHYSHHNPPHHRTITSDTAHTHYSCLHTPRSYRTLHLLHE